MKKFIIMSFVLMLAVIFNMPIAKAADGDTVLVVFKSTEDSVTVQLTDGKYTRKDNTWDSVKVGSTVALEARSCGQDALSGTAEELTINKSACTLVSASWQSSDPSVATIDESTGVLTVKGFGTTTLTVSADGYETVTTTYTVTEESSTTDTNTTTNTSSTTETVSDNQDEPDVLVEKNKTVDKEEEPIVGKQTATNPKTGLKEAAFIIVPMLLIGSGLFLRKRFN